MNAATVRKGPSLALINKVIEQLSAGWRPDGKALAPIRYPNEQTALYSYELTAGPDGQAQLVVKRRDGAAITGDDRYRVSANEAFPLLMDVLSEFIAQVDKMPPETQQHFETAVLQALSVLRLIVR